MKSEPRNAQTSQSSKTTLVLLLLFGVAVGAFYYGTEYGAKYGAQSPVGTIVGAQDIDDTLPEGVDFKTLWQVWHLLEEKHVPGYSSTTDPTDQERVWGAARGLAASLDDPYTVFLPPEDNEIFAEDISGNFEGVGMEIGLRNGYITVIAPLKGTPASKAGMLAGDIVYKIDGRETEDMSVDTAVKLIRGERGTEVVLTVVRDGESELLEISITRDVIEIPTIETTMRSDGVFVIALYNFYSEANNLFRGALREYIESGSDKLILDLRDNPGGFLDSAVEISSWFLNTGDVVLKEDYGDGGNLYIHRSKGYDGVVDDDFEMVVLINGGSASASEIVAGALSEHGIATLVGERSFGKGSVQELVNLEDGTSLKVTIARWLTPENTSISDGGLKPDVEVELTTEDIEAGRDPQLEKAVEILLKGSM